MEHNYKNGGFGYGHAKIALFELILTKFSTERNKYSELMQDPTQIEKKLIEGSEKAKKIASSVLQRVKGKLGI
jgi:tryptophanyl-tRNA synthetase